MKTVSGAMVSKKAVSLSKAARILSKFAFTDNGASPAFAAYLKRASTSFDELVQFHKEIKGPGSERKDRKKHHSSSGVVNDETLNSVKRCSKDNDFLTQEKQFSSGLKKHVDSDDLVAGNIVNSNNILKHDKKKKTDKGKEKNIDDASNRTASEIGGLDVAKETKAKKKRDKGEKSNSDLKIAVEQQSCPPSEDPANQEASEVQENDGSEERKHKKKKRMEHEEEESASNVGSKQKDQTGGNGDVDGHESGERKKQEKKQNKGGERKGEDDISRKRKHTRDVIRGGLDNSEELHQSKKKKK